MSTETIYQSLDVQSRGALDRDPHASGSLVLTHMTIKLLRSLCIGCFVLLGGATAAPAAHAIVGGAPVGNPALLTRLIIRLDKCSAVMLDKDLALTAAHCVWGSPLNAIGDGTGRQVTGIAIHPRYT